MSDLERLWDDLPVGRAPVDDILRAGRKKGRTPRRRPVRPLFTAGVLTAVGGAFLAGIIVAQPPGSAPEASRPGGVSDASPAAFHGELQPVESCDELLDHYVDQALEIVGPHGWESGYYRTALRDGGFLAFDTPMPLAANQDATRSTSEAAAAPSTSTSVNSDTGTNVQEQGVDEPDVVKTDGDVLVRIQDATLTTYAVTGKETEELSKIQLEGFEGGELLLSGDTVVALGNDGTRSPHRGYGWYADTGPATTRVVSVDISDPGAPQVGDTVDLDTSLVTARQHGSSIRLVTAAGLPELDFVQPTGRRGMRTAREANERVVRATTLADWIPSMSVDGGEPTQLADCQDMAIPRQDIGLDTMNVVGFEADAPADVHAIGLAGNASLAYESPDHLYLAASPFATWGECFDVCPLTGSPAMDNAGTTMVFDFEVTGTEATYVGSGEVEGSVADRWAMDEYDGVLRLALGPTQATGNFNSVVTLERRGDELVEVGRVDKLGVNEQIESVRWFDALAIMVTFRQIDPLYAIDLSDQDDPRLMGQLKIPGFSEYLHPLGERRLIGMGQGPSGDGGAWGAQAGLFDVTDLTSPRRIAVLGYAPGTQARAGADPRQFTWLPKERTLLTVISKGWSGRTGWVSVVSLDHGRLTNRMVEADYGNDVEQIRTVPLPDGRVVLVTGEDVEFFDL
ncbi:MAG TPA: beta-propeller domain-containing protein [Nocardioides sp.]|nr:beta-propeller domain-containing protein [Nocardioides sp.]